MDFLFNLNELQYSTIRELVDHWEKTELQLMDIQSRIDQVLNFAVMYHESDFKENLSKLVGEKNLLLKHIEQVVFYLRQKAKQLPYYE